MKIVVTGSEGSLMQTVIPRLIAQGHEIVGIDNLYRYGSKSEAAGRDYEFHQQDLIELDKVIELTKGADAILHAAAKVFGVLGLLEYRADILGTDTAVCNNICQAAVKNNIKKIVYLSSSMVYDACPQDKTVPLVEDMTNHYPMPNTDYGLSKLICERMLEAFRQQYGINYTIWRPFNIVSPHEESMTEQGFSHVLPDFVNHLMIKKLNPLPIIGNGEQIRCFTWIDDVSNLMAEYSFDDRASNEIFNICNVEPLTMKDAARLIFQEMGNNPDDLIFETTKEYVHDVKVRIPSVDKLTSKFGKFDFTPAAVSIRKCIENVL